MDKAIHHRLARWLRLAVSGAFIFHSVFTPWGETTAFASDTMLLGITPTSSAPPASVSDLLASPSLNTQGQISLSWTSPQGNVNGTPIANWPVAAYVVHYATFSADSVGGDTSAWWNATSSNTIFLAPPAYVPKAPGQFEATSQSGLIPGTRYYFGLKSISQGGIYSPIDALSSTPGQQANAVATQILNSNGTPKQPYGLSSSSNAGQFTLNWHAVTVDTNNNPIQIDHYLVSRYDAIGSTPTATVSVPVNQLSYVDTVGGLTYFYRVFAVSIGNATSAASDYMDSSLEGNRYAIAPDDVDTRVVVPASISGELNSEHDSYGQDLEVRLTRRQQDEVDVTLRSYQIDVVNVATGQPIPFFAFSQAGMQVQLGLGAALGSGNLNTNQQQLLNQSGRTTAGSIAQIVSVYWFNGQSFLRVSDPVLTSNQSLSVNVRNIGIYQIRATQISTQFTLTQNSPYPRVITPNDPSQNNRVFWFFDNPTGNPVTGTIYDIRGAHVRDLAMNGQSPTANSIVWDGRDNRGAVVPSGVYIYKIISGSDKATGTVVVAR